MGVCRRRSSTVLAGDEVSARPDWLRVHAPTPDQMREMRMVRDVLARYRLTTVCQGALCPNAIECWGARTATFMLLGDTCTRACRFCAVPTGNPHGKVDRDEPRRVAEAVQALGLRYVVLTSVDRDDLPDGGAGVFAATVRAIKQSDATVRVEALVPDFQGNDAAIGTIAAAGADVLGHNLETVRRITPAVRDPRAGYDQSLAVLARLRELSPTTITKSSLMLGLGERHAEIIEGLRDLKNVGVSIVTLGQYLQPTRTAYPVARYVPPEEFAALRAEAVGLGFKYVVAGPYVRSSYHAAEAFAAAVRE